MRFVGYKYTTNAFAAGVHRTSLDKLTVLHRPQLDLRELLCGKGKESGKRKARRKDSGKWEERKEGGTHLK